MLGSERLTVYMRQRNWPWHTGDPTNGGNLNMAWFGMTARQRRRWTKKMLKSEKGSERIKGYRDNW